MRLVMRIETTADETTVWLTGELDHHAARQLRQQVDLAVERTGRSGCGWISATSALWTARASG